MQILDPAEAQLSNYEVLNHINTTKRVYKEDAALRGPAATMKSGNLETVFKEVQDYLATSPASTQSSSSISSLVDRLSKYSLEKVELLMILNNYPKTETELDVLVEELDTRFKEEEIADMLENINEVLGGSESGVVNGVEHAMEDVRN